MTRDQIAKLIREIPDLVVHPYTAPGGYRTVAVRHQNEMAEVIADVLYQALYEGDTMTDTKTDLVTTISTTMRDELLEMLTDNRINVAAEHVLETIARLQLKADDLPPEMMINEDPALGPIMRLVWSTAYRRAMADVMLDLWPDGVAR